MVATLTLTEGTADLKAATPFSLNLKLRTGGHVRLTVSGGASKLGDLEATVQQTIGLGVIKLQPRSRTTSRSGPST